MASSDSALPPTNGLVTLVTTQGPLDIALHSQLAPTTCRNFLQHCLNGDYTGLPFHRVIPGVLIQSGLPVGEKPDGGLSAITPDGKGFRGETNARLIFRGRGTVAMADDVDDCRSQFFVTLDSCRWMDGKHCIFGIVLGDTVFNAIGIGRGTLDGETPVNPTIIKEVQVRKNPFSGMTAKVTAPQDSTGMDGTKPRSNTSRNVAGRRSQLSFQKEMDDDEDDEEEEPGLSILDKRSIPLIKIKGMVSSHDVLDDPMLLRKQAVQLPENSDSAKGIKGIVLSKDAVVPPAEHIKDRRADPSLGTNSGATTPLPRDTKAVYEENITNKSALESLKQGYFTRKNRGIREDDILARLNSFKEALRAKSVTTGVAQGFEPLVFDSTGEDFRTDDYVMLDPLEGKRGRDGDRMDKRRRLSGKKPEEAPAR